MWTISFGHPKGSVLGIGADWVQNIFRSVVTVLLGWHLGPAKDEHGQQIVFLAIESGLDSTASIWRLHPWKLREWLIDIVRALRDDWLPPLVASNMCGRLSFLDGHVFGRIGCALSRPLIWRQIQIRGTRLKGSLHWFGKVLG